MSCETICENGQNIVKMKIKMENSNHKKCARSFMVIVISLLLQSPTAGSSILRYDEQSIVYNVVRSGVRRTNVLPLTIILRHWDKVCDKSSGLPQLHSHKLYLNWFWIIFLKKHFQFSSKLFRGPSVWATATVVIFIFRSRVQAETSILPCHWTLSLHLSTLFYFI